MSQRVYLDPQRLDKRIRVERKTVTKGASGGMVTSWALESQRWAGINGKTGMKQAATGVGGGDVPEATHVITTYFIAGLSATTHRLKHGSTVYEILHVNNVLEQNVRHDLLCRTGVSRG